MARRELQRADHGEHDAGHEHRAIDRIRVIVAPWIRGNAADQQRRDCDARSTGCGSHASIHTGCELARVGIRSAYGLHDAAPEVRRRATT